MTDYIRTRHLGRPALLVPLLGIAACSGGNSDSEPLRTIPNSPSAAIAGIPDPERGSVVDETTELGTSTYTAANGDVYNLTTWRRNYVGESDEFPQLDESGVIYPGAAIQGATLERAHADPIIAPRGPGIIAISLLTGNGPVAVEVPEVNLATVTNAINSFIEGQSSDPTLFPADFTLEIEEVRAIEDLQLSLEANANVFGIFDSSASFSLDDRVETSQFLVKLRQEFYSVFFERPSTIDAFFAPQVTEQDLVHQVGPGNPATYVSEVEYGRVFYLLVEAEASESAVRATLEANLQLGLLGGGVDGSVDYMTQFEGFRVSAYAYGGDQQAALDAVQGGLGTLNEFLDALRAGGDVRTAKPIRYTVRSIATNSVIWQGYSADYEYETGALAATQVTIQPDRHTYSPPWTGGGDRDFGGNGPWVWVRTELAVRDGRLQARTYMHARETRSNWTEAQGWSPWRTIYTPPPGRVITAVSHLGDVELNYVDTDHETDPFGGSNFVQRFLVFGDRNGEDVEQYTRVEVDYVPITITLAPDAAAPASTVTMDLVAADQVHDPVPLQRDALSVDLAGYDVHVVGDVRSDAADEVLLFAETGESLLLERDAVGHWRRTEGIIDRSWVEGVRSAAIGDFDGDGQPEVWIEREGREDVFLQLDPSGQFEQDSAAFERPVLLARPTAPWNVLSSPGFKAETSAQDRVPADARRSGASMVKSAEHGDEEVLMHIEPVRGDVTLWSRPDPESPWELEHGIHASLGSYQRVLLGDFELSSAGQEILLIR